MSTGAPSESDPTIREVEDDTVVAAGRVATPARIGRYEVVRSIASGGMGSVLLARDPDLGRLVAVKVPRVDPSTPGRDEALQRFLREARAAAAISHPNVCPLHDVGLDGDQPFVVMAYIEGESLADRLARTGPLAEADVVALGIQIADGLQAVHDAGFLHRDLKPQNVLLDSAGHAFLADFGLARPETPDEAVTVDGSLLGTPAYMSQEQARGRRDEIGTASDVYGLGAILYHLLAGRPPYLGSPTEILSRLFTERPPALAAMRRGVSPWLARLVERAMSPDPGTRPRSAAEVARALRAGGRDGGGRWSRRRVAPAACALLAVLAAGAWFGLPGEEPRSDDPPPALPAALDIDGKWRGPWLSTRGESGEDLLLLSRVEGDRFAGVWWDGTAVEGTVRGDRLSFACRMKGRDYSVEGRFSPDGEALTLEYHVLDPDREPREYDGTSTLRRTPSWTGTIRADRGSYVVGERIRVQVTGVPEDTSAWAGLYPAAQASHHRPPVWDWVTGPEVSLPAHVAAGEYEVRLFAGEGYDLLGRGRVRVESETVSGRPSGPADLTAVTFNLWYDAGRVEGGLEEVVSIVREVSPDVVAFQECGEETLRSIQEALGGYEARAFERLGILSRHRVSAVYTLEGLYGFGVRIDLPGGTRVRFFDSHLSAGDYGPYLLREGAASEAVLAREARTRDDEMRRILEGLVDAGGYDPELPTLLAGDHNSPSHLDGPVPWPVSKRLAASRFMDAFRQVHPDPAARRGFTWTCGAPRGTFADDEVHDRIDFVYHRPGGGVGLRAIEAGTIDRDPWPSDHRAVFVRFSLER